MEYEWYEGTPSRWLYPKREPGNRRGEGIELDFSKLIDPNSDEQLVPAVVIQDKTSWVLMVGFMNQDAFDLTKSTGLVTFYSRSAQDLWIKGESSGDFLQVVDMRADCDNDSLLVAVNMIGRSVCHRQGVTTCFETVN